MERVEKFKSTFSNIIKHVHCVSWQHSQITTKRAALKLGEVMLEMDFAEKWRTSWQWEVSSAHYGYKLTSVFPIVAHYKCPHDDCSTIVKEAIALVSDDEKNDCDVISEYVSIAIKQLVEKSEVVISKHIWVTDQSRCQFKGARAFHRLSQMQQEVHHVYYAPGHEKSLSDGEGAVVKKHATDLLKAGEVQVENAEDFAKACQTLTTGHNSAAGIHELHTKKKSMRTVIVVNN